MRLEDVVYLQCPTILLWDCYAFFDILVNRDSHKMG